MSALPAVPVTEEDYAELVDCRCRAFPELPDVHPAGVCARFREQPGPAVTGTGHGDDRIGGWA